MLHQSVAETSGPPCIGCHRRPGSQHKEAATPRSWKTSSLYLLGLVLLAGCGKPSAPDPTVPPAQNRASSPMTSTPAAVALFEDVTVQAHLDFKHQLADGQLSNIMESDGAGGTILDYDGDGLMDVYLVNSGPDPRFSDAPLGTARWPNRLFRNKGDGTFEDVTEKAGVGGRGFGTTAAAADYDNDGHTDLLVVNFGGCILYHNEGNGTFKEVTLPAGLRTTNACISATFLDVDNDGWLDLFVANYLVYDPSVKLPPNSTVPYPGPLSYPAEFNILYRNKGDGTFEDISEAAGIRIPNHRAMSVTPLDYDLDGHVDLYVSNDGTPNLLLASDGKGHFKEVGIQCGVAFNQFGEAGGSMGAAVGDADNDGLPDFLVTRFDRASLYMNSKGGLFDDRIVPSGILNASAEYVGWGGSFLDYDNDGLQDIFIANGSPHFLKGMPALLLKNAGVATFTNVSSLGGVFFRTQVNARGCGAFDFDNDGRLDLVLTTLGDRAILLHNQAPKQNHWLTLKLEGTRSNRDGFGARAQVTTGGHTQYAEARCPTSYVFQQDTRLHFGLGSASSAKQITLRWPSGQSQTLTNVPADQILKIVEPGESRWRRGPGDVGKESAGKKMETGTD